MKEWKRKWKLLFVAATERLENEDRNVTGVLFILLTSISSFLADNQLSRSEPKMGNGAVSMSEECYTMEPATESLQPASEVHVWHSKTSS